MMIKYTLKRASQPRGPLTPEQIAEIEAGAPRKEDITYDADCPPMTEEQFRESVANRVKALKNTCLTPDGLSS